MAYVGAGSVEAWDTYAEDLAAQGSYYCDTCREPHHEDQMCPEDER